MKVNKVKFFAPLALFLLLFQGCKSEKILSTEFDPSKLNGPIGITIIPSTDLALVTNSNYDLSYETGSLTVLDLTQNKIVSDCTVKIPNFSGQVIVDSARGRVLIPNRLYNSLVVLEYVVPGADGLPISITEPDLPNSIEGLSNQILLEENPFGIILAEPAGIVPQLYVTNIKSGDASVLLGGDLSVIDANADAENPDSRGIPLISLASIGVSKKNDGVGANRMATSVDKRLIYVTSSQSNYIFVIDTLDNKVEGVIDLSKYSPSFAGMRGIVVASDGKLYVAHRALGGVIVLDVKNVTDNGINNETIIPDFLGFIPTGSGPEGIALNPAETKLYVCNEEESLVAVIDIASMSFVGSIYTERGPTEIAIHPTSNFAYVTNFLSSSVTVIDTVTDTVTGVIK